MLGKNWSSLQAALQPKRKAEPASNAKPADIIQVRKRAKKLKPLQRVHGVRQTNNPSKARLQLPSVHVEIARCRAVGALGKRFEEMCVKYLRSKKSWMHFEAWLWAHRSDDPSCDPVLPTGESALIDLELKRKLESAGASSDTASALCRDLCMAASAPLPPFESQEKIVCSVSEHLVEVGLGDFSLTLPPSRYEKLCHLLHLRGYEGEQAHHAILCCVARYHAMAGCHPRAGGMQASIPREVFDVLEKDFGVSMECFASPLNCNWSSFCSAFPDVDGPFGSLGSFFAFVPQAALSLEANPPFDAQTIARMTSHIERLLLTKIALSFTVIIPCWEHAEDPHKAAAWKALLGSRFCRHHLELAQADHAFCEGSQSAQYHIANTNTSVFFLQNAAATKIWEVTPDKLSRLQRAFRLRKS